MKPGAVWKGGVDERGGKVDPSAAGLEHPLNEVSNFGRAEDNPCGLGFPTLCHKYLGRRVDPDLLDFFIVKQWLQCAEAGKRGEDRSAGGGFIGKSRNRAAKGEFAVPADFLADEPRREFAIRPEICAFALHPLPNALGNLAQDGIHQSIL